jgi:hypothetical protein
MRLNEYMVTVDRPLGVRFALGVDGRVFVHSLRKGVSAAVGSACFPAGWVGKEHPTGE